MNEVFEALNFDLTTFIIMTLNILVVIGVLYKLFYKPLGDILETRKQKINERLREASVANLNAKLNEIRYQEQVNNARYQAKKIVNKASDIGEDMHKQIIIEAKTKANTLIDKANKEIEDERIRAKRELHDEVSKLAIATAEKILEKEIDPEKHQDLINDFLKEAGKLNA